MPTPRPATPAPQQHIANRELAILAVDLDDVEEVGGFDWSLRFQPVPACTQLAARASRGKTNTPPQPAAPTWRADTLPASPPTT